MSDLKIRGAEQHNLKGIDVDLPRNELIVITGPSGSGKSSLAFDTIYAEGQRRYVESLSAYARQFLDQLSKPAVRSIDGLSPAIAIQPRATSHSPRSTVGTVTEIADYLRLLFARAGVPSCPQCGKRIAAQTSEQIVDQIMSLPGNTRATLLAPLCRQKRGTLKLELERLRRDGFVRVVVDGTTMDLGDDIALSPGELHDLDVTIDRIVVKSEARSRIADSVELALELGKGVVIVAPRDAAPITMSEQFACLDCGISLPTVEPRLFSFNSPHGACSHCRGIGIEPTIDPERLIVTTRSLRDGAVLPWGGRGSISLARHAAAAVKALKIDPDTVWSGLSKPVQQTLLFGSKPKARRRYLGIVPMLQAQLAGEDDEGDDAHIDLGRFLVDVECTHCKGDRLRPEALCVRLDGLTIAEIGQLPLDQLIPRLDAFQAKGTYIMSDKEVVTPLLRAMVERLGFLQDVGLGYLSLDRTARSLSGGEGQRIRLATQVGSALVGVIYVLDEPSVGLHACDNARLLAALRRLVDVGSTVIMVEHDREAIMAADYLVDMGPGAGVHGGHIVAEGTLKEVLANPDSVTGPYLNGSKKLSRPKRKAISKTKAIKIVGAKANNLKDVSVDIPVGAMVAITGVSGSGKSTLIMDTLLPAARAALHRATAAVGSCEGIDGLEHFDKVIAITQSPIGRTPRSNAATYTGMFGPLRELFAGLPDARARGYNASRFSFNVRGGRCETCRGDGVKRVAMHFLPDVFVECEACSGRRYNRETLEVRFRGLSIADVLGLTAEEALPQFSAIRPLRDRLRALVDVGLGYLLLGQAANTLSGGEAQRVKLARELAKSSTGSTLYVLDEPTTGLHFGDIENLMNALVALRDQGNSLIVIEHNIEVIACCDWVVDLGPEGGHKGGRVVATGTPESVAADDTYPTGRYLGAFLRDEASKGRASRKRSGVRKTTAKTKKRSTSRKQ